MPPGSKPADSFSLRRLTPAFHEKVWGSTRLEPWFPDPDRKIGEVWFEDPAEPALLIKFLLTEEKLSVQVHPDDAVAQRLHQSRGKTEMWHILRADPGAKIAAGFRQPITPERARAAALSGEIEDLLEWFDAAPGDTFFIPAGTVHAIGAGLALCEIQEMSDVTYRLYDYGRPRELHLDQGLAVSNLCPWAARQERHGEHLVSCTHFVTDLIDVRGRRIFHPRPRGAQFLIVIQGSAVAGPHSMKQGEVWLIGSGSGPVEILGQMQFLLVGAP